MQHNKKQLIRFLLPCGVLLIAAWALYSFISSRGFHVTKTNPSTSQVATISPFLKVEFNRELDQKEISLSSSPSVISSYKIEGKTLTIALRTMEAKKKYTISIDTLKSKQGETIHGRKLSFTPKVIDFEQLPADQKQVISDQQKNTPNGQASDPILEHLPYSGIDFELSGLTNNQSKVSLLAKIILTQADMTNREEAEAAYKQEVIDYIKSIGFDPAKYAITYETQEPGTGDDPDSSGHANLEFQD